MKISIKEMKSSMISLEDYMGLIDDPCDSRFTIYHFNRLLFIHGGETCLSLHKPSRVAQVLSGVAWLSPERSTLLERALPTSFPGAGEMQGDMEELGWVESSVVSVAHLKSEEEARLVADLNSIWSGSAGCEVPAHVAPAPLPGSPDGASRSRSKGKKVLAATSSSC